MLRDRGLRVLHQYPACGFHIDLLVEREADDTRVALECDGERYHVDEHGLLKTEDIERQSILERAGWTVVRIPYRKWLASPPTQIGRVIAALDEVAVLDAEGYDAVGDEDMGEEPDPTARPSPLTAEDGRGKKVEMVTPGQTALLSALREGSTAEEDVFLRTRDLLGSQRLTQRLRQSLTAAAADLARRGLVAVEDGEYFILPAGREAQLVVHTPPRERKPRSYGGRRRRW